MVGGISALFLTRPSHCSPALTELQGFTTICSRQPFLWLCQGLSQQCRDAQSECRSLYQHLQRQRWSFTHPGRGKQYFPELWHTMDCCDLPAESWGKPLPPQQAAGMLDSKCLPVEGFAVTGYQINSHGALSFSSCLSLAYTCQNSFPDLWFNLALQGCEISGSDHAIPTHLNL